MAFNMFPWTNLHNLNADWLLKTVKQAADHVDQIASGIEDWASRLTQVETAVDDRVAYSAQSKNAAQKVQARSNIGAASALEVSTISDNLDTCISDLATVTQTASDNAADISVLQMDSSLLATRITTLENSAVKTTEQTLTETQKNQARTNIDCPSSGALNTAVGRISSLESSCVKITEQTLTDPQKVQARSNIGAISSADVPAITGAVVYNEAQTLTDAQMLQARENINAAVSGSYLRYDTQQLTAAQKQQARSNIGVSGAEDQPLIVTVRPNEQNTGYESDTQVSDITEAAEFGRLVIILFTPIGSSTLYQCVADLDATSSPNTVTAYAVNLNDAGSSTETNWFRIYMAAGSPDTLTVTQQSGRFVPIPQAGDTGKLLGVAMNGRPAWQQILPTTVTDLSSTSITLASAADNTEYNYGTLSTLTITAITNPGEFSITFTSGATATVLTVPAGMTMPDSFSVEANTRYEINCKNGYAVVAGWAVSA